MYKKTAIIIIAGLLLLPSSLPALAASSSLPSGYEKIATPKDIPLFKDVKKVGNSLWGVRKKAVAAKQPDIKQKLAAAKNIKKFSGPEEIKRFMSRQVGDASTYSMLGNVQSLSTKRSDAIDAWGLNSPIMEGVSGLAGSDGSPSSAADNDFSRTNTQVAGVDEADIVKTDGRYIYAVAGKSVHIVDAYPGADAQTVAKIELKDRPENIYLSGNFLAVMGADNSINANPTYKSFRRQGSFTFFKVYDIGDKKNPKLVRDLSYEGNYYDSRMIGDYAYLLVSNQIYDYFYNSEIVVPRAFNRGKEIRFCEGGVRCPPVYYFDMPYETYNFVNVVAINIRDMAKNPVNEVYLLAGGQSVYVSEKNIYVTYAKYLSEDDLLLEALKELVYAKLPEDYKTRIGKIEAADEQVVSQKEKARKVLAILSWYGNTLPDSEREKFYADLYAKMKAKYKSVAAELEKTVIHKITIDKEKLEYKSVGEVTGQVLNQYSMDEKDGNFRIATTRSRSWSQYADESDQQSYSNLFVLDAGLKRIGAVEKLARGEDIKSVRFMANRAYMVTFERVDPLFVINLEDPRKPMVAGELKIPGYSNYLHPYDENTLIGLGRETEEKEGRVVNKGIKLSLFDVSDINFPKEIDKFVLGGGSSYSIAETDPKAFLFSRDKSLLSIPAVVYEDQAGSEKFSMNGAAVFSVDKTGFKLRGKIDHSDGQLGGKENWWGWGYYDTTVKRSLYIKDTLYTLSSRYLQANKLETLEREKRVELEKASEIQPLVME